MKGNDRKERMAERGWGIVDSLEIKNFRGFEALTVSDLARVNIVTGDNGAGKTALLEAVFLVVSGHAQQPITLKQWRGLDVSFNAASTDSIVDGIYSDLFHDIDSGNPVVIQATGRGFENRKLIVARTRGDTVIPVKPLGNRQQRRSSARTSVGQLQLSQTVYAPISFTWTDQYGGEHVARARVISGNVSFESTGENIPLCFMFSAQNPTPIWESAHYYSSLRKNKDTELFRSVFMNIFNDITDISTETEGPNAQLLVDVPWAKQLTPLAAVSGGTARAAAFLLALTARRQGLVLIDEIENGIFYKRHKKLGQAIIELSKAYDSQVIATSHSDEWLGAFLDIVKDDDDVAFWRLERGKDDHKPIIKRFSVTRFREGMLVGDMR